MPLVAISRALASAVDEVIVVLGHDAGKLREKLTGKQVRFVDNPSYREGLSTSVRAGINAVSAHAVGIMIYLADQPLLEPEEVNSLIRAFAEARNAHKNIVVPVYHGQRGNPVIVDVSYKEAILDVVGETGCRRVIKRNPDRVLVVEMETDHAIRDVDTMEEYERLVTGAR